MTDQPTEPAIDPREVARLGTELFLRCADRARLDDCYQSDTDEFGWAQDHVLRRNRYLAGKGVTPAEDPRDAEIRSLQSDKATLVRNQIISPGEIAKLSDLADTWRARALAAESKPVEKPAEAKEPTRTERLVRFALEAKALDFSPYVCKVSCLGLAHSNLDNAEASAVRAALGEGADG